MAAKSDIVETHVSPTSSIAHGKTTLIAADDDQLHSMGYEQHMKRGFTQWSMISFCLTGLGLLPSLGGLLLLCATILAFILTYFRNNMVQPGIPRSLADDMGMASCLHFHFVNGLGFGRVEFIYANSWRTVGSPPSSSPFS